MDKQSLRALSKNELIRLLLDSLSRIEVLERRLAAYENAHTPSSKQRKSNSERDESKPRFPGKPPGSSGGGLELPPPSRSEEHTVENCPDGHSNLRVMGMRKFTTMDLPQKPIEVVEHLIFRYWCQDCCAMIEAKAPTHRYGPRLASLVVMLRNMTNSSERVAGLVRELGAPSFSCAIVQDICQRYASYLSELRNSIHLELLREPYLHIDETGLRRDGKNGYVWGVFSPKFALLEAVMSRARKVAENLLRNYDGVVVTDGYNVYDYCKLRQRCWVHFLREFKEHADGDPELTIQYERAKNLYVILKSLQRPIPDEIIETKIAILRDIVTCLKVIRGGKDLATLIENGGLEWFTALKYKDVPLENNAAERGLRHIVLHRKMMGCYRNEKGKKFIDNVISVLQTWKLQGKNTFLALSALPC